MYDFFDETIMQKFCCKIEAFLYYLIIYVSTHVRKHKHTRSVSFYF